MKLLDRLIKLCYLGLFFLTPLIVFPQTSELFEFNKIISIYTFTVLTLFLWLLKSIKNQKLMIGKTLLNIPLLLFLISQILSTIFSIDRQTSLFGYYGRFNGGLISIVCYCLLYLILISNFNKDFIFRLLWTSVLSSTLVILWALPGRFGHDLSCWVFTGQLSNNCWTDQFHPDLRSFSTLGQPNWLGAYLAVNFFIALGLFFQSKRKTRWGNLLFYLYLGLNYMTILFTRSRSALLAVGGGFMIWLVYFFILEKKSLKDQITKRNYLIVAIFTIITIFFKTGVAKVDQYISWSKYFPAKLSTISSPPKEKKPTTKLEITESFDIRKVVWQGAIDLGRKYPLFGTGVETFAYSYYFARPKAHNSTSEWDFLYNKAHNEYLNYLATTGFMGLGAYTLMIVFFVSWICIKLKAQNSKLVKDQGYNDELLIASLLISYLTILITNFFGFSTTTISLFFFLIPGFVILLTQNVNQVENSLSSKKELPLKLQFATIFLVAITVFLLIKIGCYYLADLNYAQADNYISIDDYQKAAQLLNQALSLHHEHVYEDKLSFVLANLGFVASYQKQTETANKLIGYSEKYNLLSLNEAPKNVLYWKTRAKNQYLFYQTTLKTDYLNTGLKALNQAAILSPTDPKIPYSQALYYSLLEDETKDMNQKSKYQTMSLKLINDCLNLKQDYRDAYLLKGQLLTKYKRYKEAIDVYQFYLQKEGSKDAELIEEINKLKEKY